MMEDSDFDGSTYSPTYDRKRLATQLLLVRTLMLDGEWRTPEEIKIATGYSRDASLTARLRDLRKQKFGAHEVYCRARGDRVQGLFEYRVGEAGSALPKLKGGKTQILTETPEPGYYLVTKRDSPLSARVFRVQSASQVEWQDSWTGIIQLIPGGAAYWLDGEHHWMHLGDLSWLQGTAPVTTPADYGGGTAVLGMTVQDGGRKQ